MDESFGAGGFNATEDGSAVPSEVRAQGIVPMVIKQVLTCQEDSLSLFGMSFGMVTFVAIVRSVDHSSTKITYRLEDHTGQIDAHFWLEEGDSINAPQMVVNTYARVFGSMRNQGGGKIIMVFKIEPMSTINEYTNHLLEVLNARYKAEEYSKNVGKGGGMSSSSAFANDGGGLSMMQTDANSTGLKGIQLAIFLAIKDHKSDEGISRNEIAKKFTHISDNELRNILDAISAEGHIYTSVDADHYLSTDV